MREVPGSIPSEGPRHTKDVIKMVPVTPLFSTEHSKGKILALSQELIRKINVMDKIWDRKSFGVGGHWSLWRVEKTNDHAERQMLIGKKNKSPAAEFWT